jgi:hypothetical protein
MKKKAPEQELEGLCAYIRKEIECWEYINKNGCNDPFWPDGTNMNLTRNHIIYAKDQISEICEVNNLPIPEEMYLPIPPEVNDYYMANLKQRERVKRIDNPEKITTKRTKYDREQMSLF